MRESKDRRQVLLADVDPPIALAQTAQKDLEREPFTLQPTVDELIERARKERTEFIAALLRRFTVRLKSIFCRSAFPTISVF